MKYFNVVICGFNCASIKGKNHVGNYGQKKTLWKKINVTINTHEDPQHISNGHR